MKKLIILILIPILAGCATVSIEDIPVVIADYTYESEIDPVEFIDWRVVNYFFCPDGHMHILYRNPDNTAKIQKVDVGYISSKDTMGMIIAMYTYLVDDKPHMFLYDPTKRRFRRLADKEGGI